MPPSPSAPLPGWLPIQPRQPIADGPDLCVGFVVDDAIVMLEKHHAMSRLRGSLSSSLTGSREIAFTIISMTISLAAVFTGAAGRHVGRLLQICRHHRDRNPGLRSCP
jgi:hypothetical protein